MTLTGASPQIFGSTAILMFVQLAVGVGLMYVIDQFFKFVEEKETDDTKLEIAVWLLGVRIGRKVESWPDTFANMFDRVFGIRHPSIAGLFRSGIATSACTINSLWNTVSVPSGR